jgi:ribosome-interacting GTPase 1
VLKFDFSILTKDRQPIESIVISANDQNEAERKLKQMYRYCEVVRCVPKEDGVGGKTSQSMSVEDILTLISK